MENKTAKNLLKKYLNGTCTPEEKAVIESWYNQEADAKMDASEDERNYPGLQEEIWMELRKRNKPNYKLTRYWIAAAVAIITLTSIYFISYYNTPTGTTIASASSKIAPGSNKAILVLADGSKIDLNNAQYGMQIKQNGVRIKKSSDGQLIYDVVAEPSAAQQPVAYNTVVTPRGGQFQVNLPDGTKVWLNASSSIKFPTVFHTTERIVEISGEAYFEVSKMLTRNTGKDIAEQRMPFIVKSARQNIEVLGTHFNVNAYPDEESTKTTLLEGSVKISLGNQQTILKPGQQSTLQNNTIQTAIVNREEAIAWKNGYFQFNNENIGEIMRKIARWYDVEVVYHKDAISQRFAGTIFRYEDVSKVLRMLELTGSIHFKIEGRRITVMP